MNLSDEHNALGFMLMCPAWNGLYKARIAEKVKEFYALILDPDAKVRGTYPDDYIRGYIAALKWAVEWPDQELNAAVVAAQEVELEESAENPIPLFGGRPPREPREATNGTE